MHRQTTLSNDLRIVTKNIENIESVTVLILVGAGSRYETKKIHGISHILEHMFFKGGKVFQSFMDVSTQIDQYGGEYNAFTGKEYCGYYVKISKKHLDTALKVLSDMLISPTFNAEELEKEKKVIIEEHNYYQNTPSALIGWNFESLVFGKQPIARNQIGTEHSIESVTREKLVEYYKNLYTPDNIVISVVGNLEHKEVVQKIEDNFVFQDSIKKLTATPFEKFTITETIDLHTYGKNRTHLCCGFLGVPFKSESYYAIKLLSIILGGNMSSRMVQKIRHEQSLAYSIYTSTDEYSDTGVLYTQVEVSPDKAELALGSIVKEYQKVTKNTVTETELKKAKDFLKGKLAMSMENSMHVAHFLGKDLLLRNHINNNKELNTAIDSVTLEDINQIAKQIITEENLKLAIIGPHEEKDAFRHLLKF